MERYQPKGERTMVCSVSKQECRFWGGRDCLRTPKDYSKMVACDADEGDIIGDKVVAIVKGLIKQYHAYKDCKDTDMYGVAIGIAIALEAIQSEFETGENING